MSGIYKIHIRHLQLHLYAHLFYTLHTNTFTIFLITSYILSHIQYAQDNLFRTAVFPFTSRAPFFHPSPNCDTISHTQTFSSNPHILLCVFRSSPCSPSFTFTLFRLFSSFLLSSLFLLPSFNRLSPSLLTFYSFFYLLCYTQTPPFLHNLHTFLKKTHPLLPPPPLLFPPLLQSFFSPAFS